MTPPPNYRAIAAAAARKYGVPVNVFLAQIQQESGFRPVATSSAGAQGIAQFMPATARQYGVNTADPVSSLQGAAHMDSDLIHRYGSVASALSAYNSGRPDAYKDPGFASGQTYNYVKNILAAAGAGGDAPAAAPAAAAPARRGAAPMAQTPVTAALGAQAAPPPDPRPQLLRALAASQGPDLTGFYRQLGRARLQQQQVPQRQAQAVQPTRTGTGTGAGTPSPQPGRAAGKFNPGDPVIGGTSIGGEHETLNLPGYPARDYFAPAGAAAVAPVTGKVVRLSGHDPSAGPVQGPHGPLGWSVYIQGNDGRTYYLTHMGSRNVKPGQTVKAGQTIGTVANYDKYGTPSHIHMGVSG